MFVANRKVQQRAEFTNNNNNKYHQNGQIGKKNQFANKRKAATNTPKGNREAVIARNLQHMKQVAQKKRAAQELYYGSGRSPLVKTGTPPKRFNGRVSVQHRLGDKQPNNFRNNRVNFNNKINKANFSPRPSVGNKMNFVRKNSQVYVGEMRSDKILRSQNLQQKRVRFQNPNNTLKSMDKFGNIIYVKPVRKLRPMNYTVSVDNTGSLPQKHHVNSGLDPKLQEEIKLIQTKNARQLMVPVFPELDPSVIHTMANEERLPIVATSKTLNERFSMI